MSCMPGSGAANLIIGSHDLAERTANQVTQKGDLHHIVRVDWREKKL